MSTCSLRLGCLDWVKLSTDENSIFTCSKAQRKPFHSHFFFTPLKVMLLLTSCNQHKCSPKMPFNTAMQNCCMTYLWLLCAMIARHSSFSLPVSKRLSARVLSQFPLSVDPQLHAWETGSISLYPIHPHLHLISCLGCDCPNRPYLVSPSYAD